MSRKVRKKSWMCPFICIRPDVTEVCTTKSHSGFGPLSSRNTAVARPLKDLFFCCPCWFHFLKIPQQKETFCWDWRHVGMQAIKLKKVCLVFSVQLQSGVVFKTKRLMKVVVQPVMVCCVRTHRDAQRQVWDRAEASKRTISQIQYH